MEIRGARYTAAAELRDRLGVDTTVSIWTDLEPLVQRLRQHPQVSTARIARRFPGTLVVTVEEYEPVALVPTSQGLRAVDSEGRVLPLDPSRTPVDVPIVARRDTTLLRLLGDMKAGAPDLFARVSEVRRGGRDEVVMVLVTLMVRVRPDVSIDQLAQISSVEAELGKRGVRASELDLRYRDQVIARLQ